MHLGAKSAADFVALAASVEAELQTLKDAISNSVVIAQDGGASLKSTILAALATFPGSVGATKVKAT